MLVKQLGKYTSQMVYRSKLSGRIEYKFRNNFILLDLGLTYVALTHHVCIKKCHIAYRDSETTENVEALNRKQSGGNDRKRTAITKNKHTKTEGRGSSSLSGI